MDKIKVAITGGIGSGKSTVLRIIKELGYPCFSCDEIYKDVLISKNTPYSVGVLSMRAVDLFFDYHSASGKLARLVRTNANKEKTELISLLLDKSKDYGLSDLQAERLINSNLSV